jgi:NTE family protein
MTIKKRTVSLVLGSGGARGLAHIGVIHWLEENGYEIQAISGSSMGALIGGIYAAGKLDNYTRWVRALRQRDVIRLLDINFTGAGLFSGERIMHTLKDLLGDANIEDLPIAFTAVATDLDAEREVWFRKGSLFEAIRASISIPTVLTPIYYKGHLLVDGGLINPVPIAPTVSDVTDFTLAVSLSGKFKELRKESVPQVKTDNKSQVSYQVAISRFIENLQERFLNNKKGEEETQREVSMFEVTHRSLEAMQNTIARFKLASYNPDFLIEIPANACNLFDFHRANEMIELGYQYAEKLSLPIRRKKG